MRLCACSPGDALPHRELWHRLPQPEGARSIALDEFPSRTARGRPAAEADMATLQEIIVAARNIRSEMKLDPKRKVPAEISVANPWRAN